VIRTADGASQPRSGARVSELLNERHAQSAVLTGLLGDRDDACRTRPPRIRRRARRCAHGARYERLAATSNAKEAQGLEHELVSLAKRKSDLEDAELVIMEKLETAEAAAVAQQEAAIAEINAEGARLSAEGKAAVAAATASWESATRDREALAARARGSARLYDRLAARGVGAGSSVSAHAARATWSSRAPICRPCDRRMTTRS
jgi:hypothetical protein